MVFGYVGYNRFRVMILVRCPACAIPTSMTHSPPPPSQTSQSHHHGQLKKGRPAVAVNSRERFHEIYPADLGVI